MNVALPNKRIGRCLFAVTIAAWMASPRLSEAQLVTQSLERSRSSVRFSLESPVAEFNGRIARVSGAIQLDTTSREPRSVGLTVDLSSAEVDPEAGVFPLISPETVFRAIPNPVVSFRSTSVTRTNDTTFRVSGKLVRAGRTWDLTIPVTRLRASAAESTYSAKLAGPIDLEELGLAVPRGAARGSVAGQLIFTARGR